MPNIFSLLRENRFCGTLFMTVLVCLDHVSLLVMWTPRNLKLNLLHYSPVDENGGVLGPLFPVVHTIISLVLITLMERLLSWHHPARSLTSSL